MARVQINYPPMAPLAAPTAPSAPTSTAYQSMPTKNEQFKMFGFLPFGPGRNTPVYDETDPAVRALYGLDDPNRATAGSSAPTPTAAPPAPAMTPVSSYGSNDTGRTLPFAPVPTFANNTTLGAAKAPTWAGGGDAGASSGSIAGVSPNTPFGGFLSMLFGGGQQSGGYEAALRERPADIQRLVSMTRNPTGGQNAGGFFGGMFDPKE